MSKVENLGMSKFEEPFLTTLPEGIKINAGFGPDYRSLSLLFEGCEVIDRPDSKTRLSALSLDFPIAIANTKEDGLCSIELRAKAAHQGSHSFGVVRIQANGQKVVAGSTEQENDIYLKLEVPTKNKDRIRISILLLSNAGSDPAAVSNIYLDSIDLKLL